MCDALPGFPSKIKACCNPKKTSNLIKGTVLENINHLLVGSENQSINQASHTDGILIHNEAEEKGVELQRKTYRSGQTLITSFVHSPHAVLSTPLSSVPGTDRDDRRRLLCGRRTSQEGGESRQTHCAHGAEDDGAVGGGADT